MTANYGETTEMPAGRYRNNIVQRYDPTAISDVTQIPWEPCIRAEGALQLELRSSLSRMSRLGGRRDGQRDGQPCC